MKELTNDRNKKVFEYIIKKAQDRLDVDVIFLFGSRARGNAREDSDFDFAFVFNQEKHKQGWVRFCLDVEEEVPTLLSLDLINMNDINTAFQQKITQEGIKIYSKGHH